MYFCLLIHFLFVKRHLQFAKIMSRRIMSRSEAWVCGRSPAEIVGSNAAGGMDVCVVSVVCCQVEVSATS